MASAIFKPIPSKTNNMRFVVELSREGRGLPRKKQLTAQDMTNVTPGQPRNWPIGTDQRAPLLPGDSTSAL